MIDPPEQPGWRAARVAPRAAQYYTRSGGAARPSREQVVAWSLVALLHAWLLHVLVTHSRWNAEADAERAIEVIFITASRPTVLEQPEWPRLPTRSSAAEVPHAGPDGPPTELHVQSADTPEKHPPVRLLDADGRPLAPAITEFEAWDDADWISRNRIAQLPGGSESQASYKVALRMRQAMTPQRVVMAVLQFLFGRPSLDDCRAIEGRLLVSDPGVSREIDLHKFRRTCGG